MPAQRLLCWLLALVCIVCPGCHAGPTTAKVMADEFLAKLFDEFSRTGAIGSTRAIIPFPAGNKDAARYVAGPTQVGAMRIQRASGLESLAIYSDGAVAVGTCRAVDRAREYIGFMLSALSGRNIVVDDATDRPDLLIVHVPRDDARRAKDIILYDLHQVDVLVFDVESRSDHLSSLALFSSSHRLLQAAASAIRHGLERQRRR